MDVIAVLIVPPENPPEMSNAVVQSPSSASDASFLRVLKERKAEISEGTESKPQAGTTMVPVFVAP